MGALPLWRDPWEFVLFSISLSGVGKSMMVTQLIDTVFFKEAGTIIQYESL